MILEDVRVVGSAKADPAAKKRKIAALHQLTSINAPRQKTLACYMSLLLGFSALPPAFAHSSALVDITHPLPLQELVPWQLLDAVLQALCPLQAFPPMHFTWEDGLA